jgi:hypothetical protein
MSSSGRSNNDVVEQYEDTDEVHEHTTLNVSTNKRQVRYELKRRGLELIKKKRWYTWILVVTVILLMVHTYGTYIFFMCVPLLSTRPVLSLFYMLISVIPFCLMSYCYYKTIFTHPGLVPREFHLSDKQIKRIHVGGWEQFVKSMEESIEDLLKRHEPEEEEDEDEIEESKRFIVEKSSSGDIRCCSTCLLKKPDRTHHCSACGHCVLKMDHHCPWINNCVGFYNFKYFFLFVLYTSLTCWIIVFTMINSYADVLSTAVSTIDNWDPADLIYI